MGAGSGSDGEATAGEMSDGAGPRPKKIKIGGTGPRGTPTASRAGSPNPTPGGGEFPLSACAMLRGNADSHLGASPGSQTGGVIEPWEILKLIPADGIVISDLIKFFQGRLGEKPGQMPKSDWIKMVQKVCDYGSDKRLRRRK